MPSRPKHSTKEIESVLREAERKGWRLLGHGHFILKYEFPPPSIHLRMVFLDSIRGRARARERDALSTQTAGPPLAHTIPSFSELTSADIAIVNYLQDQRLSP